MYPFAALVLVVICIIIDFLAEAFVALVVSSLLRLLLLLLLLLIVYILVWTCFKTHSSYRFSFINFDICTAPLIVLVISCSICSLSFILSKLFSVSSAYQPLVQPTNGNLPKTKPSWDQNVISQRQDAVHYLD